MYNVTNTHSHVIVEVEDGLLPVRVGRLGRSAETQPLVRLRELHVEERHQSLDEVVATHLTMDTVF